jgi:hypothetical protein
MNQLLNSKYSKNWKKYLTEQNAMGAGAVEGSPIGAHDNDDFQLDEVDNFNALEGADDFEENEHEPEWWEDPEDDDLTMTHEDFDDEEDFEDPDSLEEPWDKQHDFGWSDEDDEEDEFDDEFGLDDVTNGIEDEPSLEDPYHADNPDDNMHWPGKRYW